MVVIALIILSFVAAFITIFFGLRPLYLTGKSTDESVEGSKRELLRSVSVIVYASSITEQLHEYIKRIMRQDYPEMKVIIVCHADSENTTSLADEYNKKFDNLYFTFIPPGVKNQSRHKLAYLVGIKASDSDIVLTTNSDCLPPSDSWISCMIQPFNESDKIELVLGYSSPEFTEIKASSREYKEFDFIMTSACWIGFAKMGKTYRGDGNNIAFSRQLFFKNNGYVTSNRFHGGDDDIFVSEISTAENTCVVLNPETQLKYNWGLATVSLLTSLKERYKFSSHFLSKGPKINSLITSISQWIVLLGVASAITLNYTYCPDLFIASIIKTVLAALALISLILIQILFFKKAARRLHAKVSLWLVPIFMFWRPIGELLFYIRHIRYRNNNFIWK